MQCSLETLMNVKVLKNLKNLMPVGTSLDATTTNLEYHVTYNNFVKNNARIIDFHKILFIAHIKLDLLHIYKSIIIMELKPILNKTLKTPKQLVHF